MKSHDWLDHTERWFSVYTVGINSKSFPWTAGWSHGTAFLDIADSAVWRSRRDVANSFAWLRHAATEPLHSFDRSKIAIFGYPSCV